MSPLSSVSHFRRSALDGERTLTHRRSYDNQLNCTSDWSSSRAALSSYATIRPMSRLRDVSISTAMHELTLEPMETPPSTYTQSAITPKPPSQLPKPVSLNKPLVAFAPVSPSKPHRSPPKIVPFLTRHSHVKAWDTKGRLEDMESLYSQLTERMDVTTNECNALKETLPVYKTRSMSFRLHLPFAYLGLMETEYHGSGQR